MSQPDMGLIIHAIGFAADKHRRQRRKDPEASPYINHPLEVLETLWAVGGVRDTDVLISGVLHDTLEDTDTNISEIESRFGSHVTSIVKEVTDDKRLPKQERKRLQIETAPQKSRDAKLVKLADKICNVRDMILRPPPKWSRERRLSYIDFATQVVAGIRGVSPAMEILFDEVAIEARRTLQGP